MPRRSSDLLTFLLDALTQEIYCNLKWCGEKIFSFSPVHKNNRDWQEEYGSIYKDWYSAKPRKGNDSSLTGMRQLFLQALKKSPSVKKIKTMSTSTEYYYQIIERHKEFCDQRTVKIQCPDTSPPPPDIQLITANESINILEPCDPNLLSNLDMEVDSGYGSNCDADLSPIVDSCLIDGGNDEWHSCIVQQSSETTPPTDELVTMEPIVAIPVDLDGLRRLVASPLASNNCAIITIPMKIIDDVEKPQDYPNLTGLTNTDLSDLYLSSPNDYIPMV